MEWEFEAEITPDIHIIGEDRAPCLTADPIRIKFYAEPECRSWGIKYCTVCPRGEKIDVTCEVERYGADETSETMQFSFDPSKCQTEQEDGAGISVQSVTIYITMKGAVDYAKSVIGVSSL